MARPKTQLIEHSQLIAGRRSRSNPQDLQRTFAAYVERRNYKSLAGKNILDAAKSNPHFVLEYLFDLDPLCQDALTKFTEFADTPMAVLVRRDGKPSASGQKALDAVLRRLSHGLSMDGKYSEDRALNRVFRALLLNTFVRRAAALEVVFKDDYTLDYLLPVDPKTVTFKREEAGGSERWRPVQRMGTGGQGDIDLDIATFLYVPHSQWAESPYARETMQSAVYSVVFRQMVLQDMKEVIHRAGFPRLKIAVDLQKLVASAPKTFPQTYGNKTYQTLQEYLKGQFEAILDKYESLEPDDSIIHDDATVVAYLETQHTGRGMWDPTELLNVIEASVASALNTFATLMGRHFSGSGEGYSSFETLAQQKVWAGLRETPLRVLERALTLVLQVEGRQRGEVEILADEINLEPRQVMASYKQIELKNIQIAWRLGGVEDEEVKVQARRIVGLRGSVPAGTQITIGATDEPTDSGAEDPQTGKRDPATEREKEKKRQRTNRRRRTNRTTDPGTARPRPPGSSLDEEGEGAVATQTDQTL